MYDIIFITGEVFFDHPLCGVAILKRLLEKHGYTVAVIEQPFENDIKRYGEPKLFFGVTSGAIDSMVRNYTPLKKRRDEDKYVDYDENVPDRAVTVYSNWIRKYFKTSKMVLGGTEASLRRFAHYDYWQNRIRKPILMDTRADIVAYGSSEKQILEIANRIKNNEPLDGIEGTSIITKEIPHNTVTLPSFDEIENPKRFCDMQNLLTNHKNLIQKIDNRYVIQYKSPTYTTEDLDEYYGLDFSRITPKELRGFEFSVVTHRGCIGNCNFCSVRLTQGDRIVSRSKESILKEIETITQLASFQGNIDDLGGPSVNMYGMDCNDCRGDCLDCKKLDRTNKQLMELMKAARKVPGVRNVYIKSGIRYDLATPEYIKELAKHHIFDNLRIAPEHVTPHLLKLMNKNRGNLDNFIKEFYKTGKQLSYYFMTAHPGSTMKEAKELGKAVKKLKSEHFQVFTPTPMTVSTCMYWTGLDPKTKKQVYIPYSYREKKEQKRLCF